MQTNVTISSGRKVCIAPLVCTYEYYFYTAVWKYQYSSSNKNIFSKENSNTMHVVEAYI